MEQNMNEFGDRLKELRESKNLTIRQLSKELGISHVAVHRWESGKRYPSYEYLIMLAKFFNVSTDYLCGLES